MLLIPPPQQRWGSLVGLWRGCFPSSSWLGMRKTQQDSEGSPQGWEPAESPGTPLSPCSPEPLVPLLSIYYYYYVQVVLHQERLSPRV